MTVVPGDGECGSAGSALLSLFNVITERAVDGITLIVAVIFFFTHPNGSLLRNEARPGVTSEN